MKHSARHCGFSLVELMVGMVIGLFILGATGSVYLASKESYRATDVASRLQENGRMALRIIAEDLQLAGFMGHNIVPEKIQRRAGSAGQLGIAADDCADQWYINVDNMLQVSNDQVMFPGTCMDGQDYVKTTDIVAIKRASMMEVTHDDLAHEDWTLLRSDLSRGEFFIGGTAEPAGYDAAADTTTDRRWLNHIYFIQDPGQNRPPSLRRLYLHGGPKLSLDNFEIPGVQDLQIQFGVDTNGDGAANSFVEPDAVGANTIVAARVWVLMQSETMEPDMSDTATYTYAARSYIPGDGSGIEITANPARYRRLLLNTTVVLRN